MPRRLSLPVGDALSRERTAAMLRRLRSLKRDLKMLKAQLEAEGTAERYGRSLRVPRKK